MRITSGYLKGRPLKVSQGQTTRPTSDKVRQALFNVMRSNTEWSGLDDAVVLDAFAGSGALGIEALSNGAKCAYFYDKDIAALKAIRDNIKTMDLRNQCDVNKGSILNLDLEMSFDLVFLDPPYGRGLAGEASMHLVQCGALSDDALIVVERDKEAPDPLEKEFELLSQKTYGRTIVEFYLYKK